MVIPRCYKQFLLALSYVTSYYTQNLAIIMNGMFSFRRSYWREKKEHMQFGQVEIISQPYTLCKSPITKIYTMDVKPQKI